MIIFVKSFDLVLPSGEPIILNPVIEYVDSACQHSFTVSVHPVVFKEYQVVKRLKLFPKVILSDSFIVSYRTLLTSLVKSHTISPP